MASLSSSPLYPLPLAPYLSMPLLPITPPAPPEWLLFVLQWFWRRDHNGTMAGYPAQVSIFWYGFPDDLEKFDAVYERVDDGKIVFFSGEYQ